MVDPISQSRLAGQKELSVFNILEEAKLVQAIFPQAGAAITGAYVSLKNYAKAYVIVHINQAAANTVAISIEQAQAIAGTNSKVITKAVPIWADLDEAASDALARAADAVNYTTDAGTKYKVVVFEVDPTLFDIAGGFDCLTVKTGASAAGNITSALYLLVGARYQQALPPTAVVD